MSENQLIGSNRKFITKIPDADPNADFIHVYTSKYPLPLECINQEIQRDLQFHQYYHPTSSGRISSMANLPSGTNNERLLTAAQIQGGIAIQNNDQFQMESSQPSSTFATPSTNNSSNMAFQRNNNLPYQYANYGVGLKI
jgi:hypothetical protein